MNRLAREVTYGSFVLLSVVGLVSTGCSDDSNNGGTTDGNKQKVIIGSIRPDDVSSGAKRRLAATRLAVDEINRSGALDFTLEVSNKSPATGDRIDADKAAQQAKELFDQAGVVAVTSTASSLAAAIIGVTNTSEYADYVQCNDSATRPSLNDQDAEGADKNDVFYRPVATDFFQAKLMAKLAQEKPWTKVGIYYIDDPFGQGLRAAVKAELSTLSGMTIAFDKSHSNDFNVEDAGTQSALNEIVALSGTGAIEVLILPSLSGQASTIIKSLTEKGFKGALLLADGAKSNDLFGVATGLGTWLAQTGNEMLGTEPDNYAGGESSDTFTNAFKSAYAPDEPESYSSTAYDCAYAIAYALAYAGSAKRSAAGVKEAMQNFKENNRTSDEVDIGVGPDEFEKGVAAIQDGKRINYLGASGRLLFDANGDRPSQGMRVFGPNAGVNAWEVKARYDEELNALAE